MVIGLLNPQRFLFIGGATLVLLGTLGIIRVLGSLSDAAFFHPPSWINWLHLGVGSLVLVVAWRGDPPARLALTMVAAVAATGIGLGGLVLGARGGANQATDPSDHLAHLLVGLTAAWALLGSR
jgi:hypothetical protein